MSNYYDILGISQQASQSEVKAAFRRLAKLYHPDKNPSEKEHFNKILKAYETLVDPAQRKTYDRKLSYNQNQGHPQGKKAQSFEEQEQKRRQYYDEHIRKYEKPRPKASVYPSEKAPYNEYKYILFATPLAVALLLLVLRLAVPETEAFKNPGESRRRMQLAAQAVYTSRIVLSTSEHLPETVKNLSPTRVNNETGMDVLMRVYKNKNCVANLFVYRDSSSTLFLPGKGPFIFKLALARKIDKVETKSRQEFKFQGQAYFFMSKTTYNLQESGSLNLDRSLFRVLLETDSTEFLMDNPR